MITRGGGSIEDLLPFSNEALVRAVAGCRTPIVSAIGHEQDTPLLDLVADVRASTPTDAAKRVVPDVLEELDRIAAARRRLARPSPRASTARRATVLALRSRPCLAEPQTLRRRARQADVVALRDRVAPLAVRLRSTGPADNLRHTRARVTVAVPGRDPRARLRGAAARATAASYAARATPPSGELLRARLAEGELSVEVRPTART